MKVGELIEQLKQFDGDCEVMLSDGNILTDTSPIAAIVASLRVGEEDRKEIILAYVRREQPDQLWEYSPPISVPAPQYDPLRVWCTNETTATNKTDKDDSK